MTTFYPMATGQGTSESQNDSPNGQTQSQGLMFPDTTPVASSAMLGNGILGHDMHPNNFNFDSGAGNQMPPQVVGSGFHSELHFTGGYLENQAGPNVLPFETTPSILTTAATGVYPNRLTGPPPRLTEQSEVKFEGYPLDLVGLTIHDSGDAEELARRRVAIQLNQKSHRQNPPVIPDHTLGEMTPKRVFPDFIKPSQSTSPEEKLMMERENNRLAAQLQKEDRARNNEAAKRSRLAKSEALCNATKLNITQFIRIAWLEAKVIGLGGSLADFDAIRPDMLLKIRNDVLARMDAVYAQRKKNKAEEESRRRALRNKERQRKKAAANERFARQRAEATRAAAASTTPGPQVQAAPQNGRATQMDWASFVPSYDFGQN
ncbi:uncharacterized protein MAM_04300 [Metarhizium album ARSEF 1941]|uniref:BZIP domain-containing protein n=1 Tax=Metarhizium album (strain ARSEF 1941) TaxID=1081103 RepID=A0A0B2WPE4_METAS|nr:uncharacterized protein MAM_04300 [Metarhizium album ARSEF 1941]KHN97911.1 hypothetical protein MAM_04300 [Metarhizium album ARSEF 1941]